MDMEYVVGSVADLISGNLTPSRPANVKRARTPMKHQPSPHVTPRGEGLPGGREALLSPSILRKQAIPKKSPKRIFEREDLDKTVEDIVNTSPKADKVRKHLEAALNESEDTIKSPMRELNTQLNTVSHHSNKKKNKKAKSIEETSIDEYAQESKSVKEENKETGSKKKKKLNKKGKKTNVEVGNTKSETFEEMTQRSTDVDDAGIDEYAQESKNEMDENKETGSKKKKKRNKKGKKTNVEVENTKSEKFEEMKKRSTDVDDAKKNRKNKKTKKNHSNASESVVSSTIEVKGNLNTSEKKGKKNNRKNKNKKNAVTPEKNSEVDNNDSDSEHDSDNEIESETEQDVRQILDSGPVEDDASSDEEEEVNKLKKAKNKKKENAEKDELFLDEEETKRTLFVGNVPLSKKCKKDVKQIFNKYGTIESVRIRAVPVKDMRTNPKVAAITNDIHPDRTSVNIYVKFSEKSSVIKALSENNRLMGDHHLRVTRADTTGKFHDPRKTIFVGNVPFGIEDETLRATFSKCGEIDSVRIVRDRKLHIGKGFGYVNFASTDGVELALTLTEEDLTIKNRILRVRRSTPAAPGHKVKGLNQFNKGGRNQGDRGYQNKNQGNRNYQNRDQGSRGYQNREEGNKGFRGDKVQGNSGYRANRDRGRQNENNSFAGKPRDESGALRRINKRQSQDNSAPGAAPPQKRQKTLDQPVKEKKQKKEFVGMTAEKKKKRKFNKGSKQKKKLSEILTKS